VNGSRPYRAAAPPAHRVVHGGLSAFPSAKKQEATGLLQLNSWQRRLHGLGSGRYRADASQRFVNLQLRDQEGAQSLLWYGLQDWRAYDDFRSARPALVRRDLACGRRSTPKSSRSAQTVNQIAQPPVSSCDYSSRAFATPHHGFTIVGVTPTGIDKLEKTALCAGGMVSP